MKITKDVGLMLSQIRMAWQACFSRQKSIYESIIYTATSVLILKYAFASDYTFKDIHTFVVKIIVRN